MWTYLFLWMAVALYVVLVASTVTVVLLENRQPAKTIAWTIVLIMLPVLGLVIFYFFGQNIRKDRYISRKQYSLLTRRMLAGVQQVPLGACPKNTDRWYNFLTIPTVLFSRLVNV